MVSIETFRQMALSFPGASEQNHFGRPSFRVNKKIFATIWTNENRAMIKLNPVDQSVFCAFDNTVIYPVPGGWGRQGATFVELAKVRKAMLKDAVTTAWLNIVPKNLKKK